MKRIYFYLFLLLSVSSGAQNLVPNPSFEIFDTCPHTLDQVKYAVGWHSVRPSPDYFNSCDTIYSSQSASVPINYFGYHYPASGNGYAGFEAKDGYFEVREYLGTQLITPLQIGHKYFASIKVSLATNGGYYCGINKLGILFSTINYSDSDMAPTCNCAQVYTDSIITDTLNWIIIKGSFIADSSYSFISLGNFFVDSLTDSTQVTGSDCVAYYYIDDICVSTDSTYCFDYVYTGISNIQIEDSFTYYPNPVIDFLYIDEKARNIEVFKLYDMYGHLLRTQASNHTQHYAWNLAGLSSGAYMVIVYGNNSIVSNHIVIKL